VFSFFNKAGGSAGPLVCCPKALAMTWENRLNYSSFSVLYSSSGYGAGLSSRLPFLLLACFFPDHSPSSSRSRPPLGAPAAPHLSGGGGGFPPPVPESSGVGSDAFPCPFTCPINCSTKALSTEISPFWACQHSGCCRSSRLTRLMLIS